MDQLISLPVSSAPKSRSSEYHSAELKCSLERFGNADLSKRYELSNTDISLGSDAVFNHIVSKHPDLADTVLVLSGDFSKAMCDNRWADFWAGVPVSATAAAITLCIG